METTLLVRLNRDSKYYIRCGLGGHYQRYYLTKGKVYQARISDRSPRFYVIKNDLGQIRNYSIGFFTKVEEQDMKVSD